MDESLRLEFIKKVSQLVQKYESPISEATRIAQACHETGFGASELANLANNLFGIKASAPWSGAKYPVYSPEWSNGVKTMVKSEFRKYGSWELSIKDNSTFYTSTDHRKNVYSEAINGKTYKDEAQGLTGPGRYATDPNYAKYLIEVVEKYNLTQYNKKTESGGMSKKTAAQIAKQVWGTQTIEKSLWNGYAGRISGNPRGVVIHNDAGRANGRNYESWLRSDRVGAGKAERGFAHYYTCRQFNARYEHTFNKAYHGGHSYPNNYLIGFEVVESLSATDANFLKNEEVNMLQAAEDLLYYKLPVNHDTVKLHRDYSSTTCPHRSWDLHVGRNAPNNAANRQKMRQYFIDRIKYWTRVLNGEIAIPGTVTPPTVPNDTPKAPDNSTGYKITAQTRRVGKWIANQRTAPSTAGKITFELEANFYFEVKGYVHGQSIDGNDIWFVGANSGQYVHSGGTTFPSTANLTHLVSDPHNKVKKSYTTTNNLEVTVDELIIYDAPGTVGKRKGVAKKGTKIDFDTVYLKDDAVWVGYTNGKKELCYLNIAGYDSKTSKIKGLQVILKEEIK